MCGKFGLLAHIDGSAPARPTDPSWQQAHCCIHSWLFGFVTDAVLDLALDVIDQTAPAIVGRHRRPVPSEQGPACIFLSHESHSLTQGDSSIDDYCLRVKTDVDTLHDVGQPVSESTLVLNLVRGLNKPYSNTADNIADGANLTFASTRNQLLLNELHLKNEDKVVRKMDLDSFD